MASRSELRVLRLTPHFHREGTWPVAFDPVGGLQIQTFALARGVDQSGIAQTVAATHMPGSPRRQLLFDRTEFLSVGPRVPAFLAGPLLCFSWFLGVLALLVRNFGRYDIVHIHFNHSVWCRVLVLLLGRTRLPVVVSLNTALWGGLRHALRLEGSRFDLPLLVERLALRQADRVVALTAGAARQAESVFGVPSDTIAVIPDAVAVGEFQASPPGAVLRELRQRHGIPDGWRVVSYVGRISEEKGWRDLPSIARALAARGAFLLICGDGPDRAGLEAAFHREGMTAGWAITGFLPPSSVRQVLKMTDVLVLPSRREIFGSVLLEAMASGVPAVAYAAGGIVDVAGEPPAVSLAAPGDIEDLLARVFALLDDPVSAARQVVRGSQRVSAFAIERSVALTLSLYDELLPRRAVAKALAYPAE